MALTLNADSRGTGGTPVLFVHSFAGDLTHWSAAQEHLKAKRRSVAFDLSAHGASPGALGSYTIQELAKDVAAVAGSQGLENFVLVGHGTGAQIAAEYSRRYPQRVKALCLVDPPPAPALPKEQLEQLRAAVESDPYGAIERYWREGPFMGARAETQLKLLASLHRLPRKTAIELTASSLEYDATAPLRGYTGPKFAIVTPNNDTASSLHNVVPAFQHTVAKGTGHWIQLDDPPVFNQLLDLFLPP
ncbi:MAG: alpha/beta hydrolase [Pseudomonadota bacterium]